MNLKTSPLQTSVSKTPKIASKKKDKFYNVLQVRV